MTVTSRCYLLLPDVVVYLAGKGGREAVVTKYRLGFTPLMVTGRYSYSCTWDVERFFEKLIQDRKVRYVFAGWDERMQGERDR